MAALTSFGAEALALGDFTLVTTVVDATAVDGDGIDAAMLDATSMAVGDAFATTVLVSFTYAGYEDGSDAWVETATSGSGVGDHSHSISSTTAFAISTPNTQFALGIASSAASGTVYEDAYASVAPHANINVVHTVGTDAGISSSFLSFDVASVHAHSYTAGTDSGTFYSALGFSIAVDLNT